MQEIINTYIDVLTKKYVAFQGRANRKEFWTFTLANALTMWVLQLLTVTPMSGLFFLLFVIFALGTFLPSLAVSVRRLHDLDKTGWWFLIALVPLVGSLVLLVFYCMEGTKGPNRFGADPYGNTQPKIEEIEDF